MWPHECGRPRTSTARARGAGRRRHSHVARKIVDRRRIDLVEVVEDAGLMAAEQPVRARIANMPRVTGEIDARIERHHLACGVGNPNHEGDLDTI